jgi:6-phosphogluconolactonase/glucosamine-6-phosphate isomerase/deaminase
MLKTARVTVLIALGSAKAPALRRLLQRDPELPASVLEGLAVVTDVALFA